MTTPENRDPQFLRESSDGALRDAIRAASADEPRERDLAGLEGRLAPLFALPLPVAAAGAGAAKAGAVKGAVAAAKGVFAMKILVGVVAVASVGGGAYYVEKRAKSPSVPATTTLAAPPTAIASPPVPAVEDAPPAVIEPAPDPAPALDSPPKMKHSNHARAADADPSAEYDLVSRGGDALLQHRPADALALATEHARRFPSGTHAEDRERIAIEALVALGRTDDARARTRRFFVRFPHSAYRSRIETIVPGVP